MERGRRDGKKKGRKEEGAAAEGQKDRCSSRANMTGEVDRVTV